MIFLIALQILNDKNIVHSDMKPDNLILKELDTNQHS